MRKFLAACAISAMAISASPGVIAGYDQFGMSPAACEEAVAHFLDQRLSDPRSARLQLTSDPYRVVVSMRGGQEVSAWAVDVRVKSRLPSGSWSNYQPYTVIFQNGDAVALEGDFRDVTRV